MQIYDQKLTNVIEMVNKAKKNKYAVPHFNVSTIQQIKTLLEIAQETKTPMIIASTEGGIKTIGGFDVIAKAMEGLLKDLNITVPIALHLDHCNNLAGIEKALKAGFSSVMYDGNKLPFEENFKNTKKVVEMAKKYNVSVEAEIGAVGGEEDGMIAKGEIASETDAKKFASLGINTLAAGIGNIHGIYPKSWKTLNFDIIPKLASASNLPLVLHGGSGIPYDQVAKAISLGVAKANVGTQLSIAYKEGLKAYFNAKLDEKGKGYNIRNVSKAGLDSMKKTVMELIDLFGCKGRA